MNRLHTFGCGIRTKPGSTANWTWRAVQATHLETPYQAQAVEYYTPAIGRPFRNKHRAQRLLATVLPFVDRPLHVAVHSNGADVLMDAMKIQPFHIEVCHMISPAISADCRDVGSGLNKLLYSGKIKQLHIWIGGKDWALRLGKTAVGQLWGYGALGLDGPKYLLPGFDVTVRREPDFGHETWFDEEHFDDTMKRIWGGRV